MRRVQVEREVGPRVVVSDINVNIGKKSVDAPQTPERKDKGEGHRAGIGKPSVNHGKMPVEAPKT